MNDEAHLPAIDDRTSYVGGPGAAAVLGVSPYLTPVALWQQLTGRAPPFEINDVMRSGQRLERAVLDYAGEELKTTIMPGPFVRDVKLPLAGHIDGVAEATGDLVEAKTARVRQGWGEPGTDEVPAHIVAQALHYLGLVPGARVCWVPVLFSNLEFAMYKIDRNDALIERIKNLCWAFWRDHVLTDIPPAPRTGADAVALFPRDAGTIAIADDVAAEAIVQLRELKAMAKDIETRIEDRESRIKLHMKDAGSLSLPDGEIVCSWRTVKSNRFDSSAFKSADAARYAEFCREVSSRRFLLK